MVPTDITDIIGTLIAEATTLGARLNPSTAVSLAHLVRIMNCYYSNLIEGHKTHPRDIEKAMNNEFESNPDARNLQIEARAHIRIQLLIDQEYAKGPGTREPTSVAFIKFLHKEFYHMATPEMLTISGPSGSYQMIPGEFRSAATQDNAVGRHIPPSSDRVSDLMRHFQESFDLEGKGPAAKIIAMAAAHHRLNYIHPFPDGNGRVSRLMSHAMGHEAGIGAHGLWSIARGLARGLESSREYKLMMAHADTPRQGDLDGRGNLSLRALTEYIEWYLKICLDQVSFMGRLFDLDALEGRFRRYVQMHGSLRPEATHILDHVLLRGEMARGDASRISGLRERAARDLLGELVRDGILGSATPKGPVSLRFPIHAVDILFPRLFPQL